MLLPELASKAKAGAVASTEGERKRQREVLQLFSHAMRVWQCLRPTLRIPRTLVDSVAEFCSSDQPPQPSLLQRQVLDALTSLKMSPKEEYKVRVGGAGCPSEAPAIRGVEPHTH